LIIFSFWSLISLSGQTTNPFDIIRSSADSIAQELVSPVNNETKLEGDNPFSVSHIPIRKNQYKEIQKLAITNRTVEQQISLTSLPIWVLIISLCVLAFILFNKKDHLAIILRSLANENFMKMTNYEANGGRSLNYILGYLVFLLNFTLFLHLGLQRNFTQVSQYLNSKFGLSGWRIYILLLLACVCFFIGKHLVNMFFSWVFRYSKEASLYDFTIISIYNLVGIIFLMLNILIIFGPDSWLRITLLIGVTIFIIFLLSRHYKGMMIGKQLMNSYFIQFFLYFCTFEISPWVVVYSFFKDFI